MRNSIIAGWRKPGLINYLLYPLSLLYRFVAGLRHYGYRIGLFKTSRLPVPVIVVGNITVGGSGKTPLVIAIVEYLKEQGRRPGVISRGYGGDPGFWPREVGSDTNPQVVGDEPQLIFERTGAPVMVGPDRVRSGTDLVDTRQCDVLVCDDGFQHFALQRNLDIVLVDGDFGFGNGWCLPAGPLREPVSAMNRAGLVVINGRIGKDAPKTADAAKMEMVPSDARNLVSGEQAELVRFSGATAHAVAGIGNPQRFFHQLEEQGIQVIAHAFPDHHPFTEQDISFGDDCPVLLTEKDGIKCREFAHENIWVVNAGLEVDPRVFENVESCLNALQDSDRPPMRSQ